MPFPRSHMALAQASCSFGSYPDCSLCWKEVGVSCLYLKASATASQTLSHCTVTKQLKLMVGARGTGGPATSQAEPVKLASWPRALSTPRDFPGQLSQSRDGPRKTWASDNPGCRARAKGPQPTSLPKHFLKLCVSHHASAIPQHSCSQHCERNSTYIYTA